MQLHRRSLHTPPKKIPDGRNPVHKRGDPAGPLPAKKLNKVGNQLHAQEPVMHTMLTLSLNRKSEISDIKYLISEFPICKLRSAAGFVLQTFYQRLLNQGTSHPDFTTRGSGDATSFSLGYF